MTTTPAMAPDPQPQPIGVDPATLIQAYGGELAQMTSRALMAEAAVAQLRQQLATQSQQAETPTMDQASPPE